MSWLGSIRNTDFWDPFEELLRIQGDMAKLYDRASAVEEDYPRVNLWSSANEARMTVELPGISADDLDINVGNSTVTLKGSFPEYKISEGERFARQERPTGQFMRTVELPFAVDSNRVEASYKNGVLSVTMPRLEADKPRKIRIS